MKCIIIDDEAAARAIMEHLCEQVSDLEVLASFPNAIEGIKFLNQHKVDLIFLDIHMPDFSGFDFIQTLKNPPSVVLTTSDSNFAIEAFEYDCIVDYLLKPVELPRFIKAVQKVNVKRQPSAQPSSSSPSEDSGETQKLYINIDRRLIKIDLDKIYLVEAKGDYILIKTDDQNYTVHSTLKKIEEKLPGTTFLKVHRSYIINVDRIIDIEDNSVLIAKDVIPISRSNRPELMKRLNLL